MLRRSNKASHRQTHKRAQTSEQTTEKEWSDFNSNQSLLDNDKQAKQRIIWPKQSKTNTISA